MRFFETRAQRIGWLFVAATVAGVASVLVMASALDDDDLLAAVSSHQGSLLVGELLIFVMIARGFNDSHEQSEHPRIS